MSFTDVITPLFMVVISVFLAVAVVFDLRSRRIPNVLTFAMLGVAFAYQLAYAVVDGWQHLGSSASGCAAGFGIMFVLWLAGGGGGGDVKLMAALGASLGFERIITVFFLSTLLVAIALAGSSIARWYRTAVRRPENDADFAAPAERPVRHTVAFATPIALATWGIMLWTACGPLPPSAAADSGSTGRDSSPKGYGSSPSPGFDLERPADVASVAARQRQSGS